jgi:hypothetical protein
MHREPGHRGPEHQPSDPGDSQEHSRRAVPALDRQSGGKDIRAGDEGKELEGAARILKVVDEV